MTRARDPQGTCQLCQQVHVPVDTALDPWPRLAQHRTPHGQVCHRGAPASDVSGCHVCRGRVSSDSCTGCLALRYEQETGRNAPRAGDYPAWYSEFLNTGHDLARRLMEDAVELEPALVIPPRPEPPAAARRPGVPARRDALGGYTVALIFFGLMAEVLLPGESAFIGFLVLALVALTLVTRRR